VKKLTLTRETLSQLSPVATPELEQVNGGTSYTWLVRAATYAIKFSIDHDCTKNHPMEHPANDGVVSVQCGLW
jgi:hypothetical protein